MKHLIYLLLFITAVSCKKTPYTEPVIPSVTTVSPGSSTTSVPSSTTTAPVSNTSGWIDTWNRAEVVKAYKEEFGTTYFIPVYTGDFNTCNAGTLDKSYQNLLFKRLNYYRKMAGVHTSLIINDSLNRGAQAGAQILGANRILTHTPLTTSKCFTLEGNTALANSNLTQNTSQFWDPITALMLDGSSQDNTDVGHRRSLIREYVYSVGFGTTVNSPMTYGVIWMSVHNPKLLLSQPTRTSYISYPAEGYVPYPLAFDKWSITLDGYDFKDATVYVSKNGDSKQFYPNISKYTHVYVWNMGNYFRYTTSPFLADETYEITIQNIKNNDSNETKIISYKVVVTDPNK